MINIKKTITATICILLFIACQSQILAQDYTVKGKVIDDQLVPLIGAVVVLITEKDSTLSGFGNTEKDGSFTITDVKNGAYQIQITYIGYGTIQKLIKVEGQSNTLDLGNITMTEESKMIDAVTITAEYTPIRVTKDTIEYNADAFKTQPNAVVEELLKKLPGVEVESDGTIKVKGEEVTAVTVDGKDFFGKDPKMATKNLPADAVKKVQVFDKKSKTSEFTGIDDGNDQKTINLELKDDKKGGYFGNVLGGYGTDSRYEGKVLINRFNKNSQISFIGSLNNINNTGVSFDDYSAMSGNSGGNFNIGRNSPVNFGGGSNGDIQSITAGVNFNYNLGKKNTANISYFLTKSDAKLIRSSETNTFLIDRELISNGFSSSNPISTNHNFSTRWELKLDSMSEMTIEGSALIRKSDNQSFNIDTTTNGLQELLNINDQSNFSNNNSSSISSSINYRRKFTKKGRSFTLNGSIGIDPNKSASTLLSEVYDDNIMLILDRSVFQFQQNNNANNNYSIGGTYSEPLLSNLFLTTSATYRYNNNDIDKLFYNIDPFTTTVTELNEELSRTFDNGFTYAVGGLNLSYHHSLFRLNGGVEYQNSHLEGIPSLGAAINKDFNYFLPKAGLEFENTSLRLNYNTSVREPSLDQLQPIVDNSDPLNLYVGNPNLNPEYRHNVRLSYNFFDQFNFKSLFANIRYGYTKDRITTSTTVDQFNVRQRTPLNTDYEQSLSASLFFSSPLNIIKAKYRLGVNSSLTSGFNFINGVSNKIDRLSNGISATLENKSKSKIDLSATARFSFNNNIYKDNTSLNTSFVNQTYEGAIAYYPGKNWTIDTRMEYNIYGQGSFGESTSIKLWQASVSKGFWDNKLVAKLRVFDILNQNQSVNRNATETYISETISNTIGRYGMVSLFYNINALGSATPSPSRGVNIRM